MCQLNTSTYKIIICTTSKILWITSTLNSNKLSKNGVFKSKLQAFVIINLATMYSGIIICTQRSFGRKQVISKLAILELIYITIYVWDNLSQPNKTPNFHPWIIFLSRDYLFLSRTLNVEKIKIYSKFIPELTTLIHHSRQPLIVLIMKVVPIHFPS